MRRQHNNDGTEDGGGRDCWRTARERERLRARFHIRERVATNGAPAKNDDEKTLRPETTIDDAKPSLTLYISYIKAGDRSKFSLSQLDRHFDVMSSRIPMSLLLTQSDDASRKEGWTLLEHSLQLCRAWFGVDYAQTLRNYMNSLVSFTLMEYAAWMGKYSIVGAMLLAGVNPCRRGRRRQNNMEESGQKWSTVMGACITKRFFDCFPLALSTYIVKRVVELRRDGWAAYAATSNNNNNNERHCELCRLQSSAEDDDELLYFTSCCHWLCERCFWSDLLENLDDRRNDVIVCPSCGCGEDQQDSSTIEHDCIKPDQSTEDWNALPPEGKREKSLSKFHALPADRKSLKASGGKKKKPSERDHWASSWNEAVLPSLGSTQAVRRDKFFSFVERNAVHHVRGCLYAGVDVDWINEYGQTPLYICAWRGYESMARLLLRFGASADRIAHDDTTPIQVAKILGHQHVKEALEQFGAGALEAMDDPSRNFPSNSETSLSRALTTLISRTMDHAGAGSYTIDDAISPAQIDWLLSLHSRIPVDTTQKKKAGLCSERSYFCDSSEAIAQSLEAAIRSSDLVSETDRIQVFAHMRFLHYSIVGTTLNPHVDICRMDPISGIRSTHTFILYLTDCPQGGETSLLEDISGEARNKVLAVVSPKRGRLLLFPHACPHEGNEVKHVPKILLRGEVFLECNP